MQSHIPSISLSRQILIVLFLMSYSGLGYVNRISMSVAGTEHIIKEYSVSETEMGAVYSAFLFAYTICMIPGGLVVDRIGPKRALVLVGFTSAIFVALTGLICLAPALFSLMLLLVIRGSMGAVSAPLFPGCSRMVSLAIPFESRALVNGLVTGAALLGIASTFRVFGFLMDQFGWPQAFLVLSIFTLVLSAGWMLMPIGSLGTAHAHSPSEGSTPWNWNEMWKLFLNVRLMLLSFSYAAVGYFQYLFFYWMQYYFTDILKISIADARYYAAIPFLAMAAGMPIGGLIADRLAQTKRHPGLVPIVALILGAGFVMLGIQLKSPQQVSLCFALAMGFVGFSEGPYWTMAVAIGRRYGGMSGAVLNTIGNLGGNLAPYFTPLLAKTFGWGWKASFALASISCLIGALLWVGIRYEPEE